MGFLLCYLITGVLFGVAGLSGSPLTSSLLLAFLLVPTADLLVGKQRGFSGKRSLAFYKVVAYAWAPFYVGLLGTGFYFSSKMSALEAVSWGVPYGLIAGAFGITLAHEIGHRYDSLSQQVATLLLSLVCYPHFTIEHNLGHHRNVATVEDPATAKYGESLWAFVFRTVPQQFIHAWSIEQTRLKRLNKPEMFWHNQVLIKSFYPVILALIIFVVFGANALLLFIVQAGIAIFLLEAVNYVEHYGLQRKVVDGRYERVDESHSWDSNFTITNHLLFGLQHHAAHHAYTPTLYHDLRPSSRALKMPAGYPLMVILAMVPPLWRRIIHPIMEKRSD